MFDEVAETLRKYLLTEIPINNGEVEISFDRPVRDWSGRLTRPSINLFLYDIRENFDYKDEVPYTRRDENGNAIKQRPPRRIDLAYLITVWTKEADDEHRILGRVLAALHRNQEIPRKYYQGSLEQSVYSLLGRVTPSDEIMTPSDLWNVMDNEMHAGLSWIITTPLEVFAAISGPLVRTKVIGVGFRQMTAEEEIRQVAGVLHRKGKPTQGIAGAKIVIKEIPAETFSRGDGVFSFTNLPPGEYTWVVTTVEGQEREVRITIPSPQYDIEI